MHVRTSTTAKGPASATDGNSKMAVTRRGTTIETSTVIAFRRDHDTVDLRRADHPSPSTFRKPTAGGDALQGQGTTELSAQPMKSEQPVLPPQYELGLPLLLTTNYGAGGSAQLSRWSWPRVRRGFAAVVAGLIGTCTSLRGVRPSASSHHRPLPPVRLGKTIRKRAPLGRGPL